MNVYITTSIATPDAIKENIKHLSRELKKEGHKVNDSRLEERLKDTNYDDEELTSHYKKMTGSIKQCDIMIAEISSHSSGVGYEIGLAVSEKKPILALYSGEERKSSSLSLTSNPEKLVTVKNYSIDNVTAITREFINKAKERIDTKFILIISPEIDKYLEWSADERRMHKAQIVRNAIEDMMNKDKEYKDFLKEQDLA